MILGLLLALLILLRPGLLLLPLLVLMILGLLLALLILLRPGLLLLPLLVLLTLGLLLPLLVLLSFGLLLLLPLLVLLTLGLLLPLLILLALGLLLVLLFRGLGLLLLLFRGLSVLLVLILLCVYGSNGSEKKEQKSRADSSYWFHVCCLRYVDFRRRSLFAWGAIVVSVQRHNAHPLHSCRLAYAPTRMWENAWKSPKMFRSHKTVAITTTAFKMDLIVPCIGMKRLTSQSRTPTTSRIISI